MINYSNSKVTIELRDVLASVDENGNPFKLWDFVYPSYYKGDAKIAFEQKVIDHYLFHQIGVETVARFKHNFKTRVCEIMPYYLQLYKSVEIMEGIDDPFGNVDIIETFEQTTTGTSSGTSSNTETGTSSTTNTETGASSSTETATKTDTKTANEETVHRFSSTPQGSILNIDDYLTEASMDSKDQSETIESTGTVTTENENERNATATGETSSTVTGSGETSSTVTGSDETSSTVTGSGETSSTVTGTTATENNGTVTHTLTRKGNQGVNTYAHDMIEYRQTFINVDMMIIGALRDLFLLVY